MGLREVELEITSILGELEVDLNRDGIVEEQFLTTHDRARGASGWESVEFNRHATRAFKRILSLVMWTKAEKFEDGVAGGEKEPTMDDLAKMLDHFGIGFDGDDLEDMVGGSIERQGAGTPALLQAFARAIELSGCTYDQLREQATTGDFESVDAMVAWGAITSITEALDE